MYMQYSNGGFMSVRKTDTGWEVDVWPQGRAGRRIRKVFLTKAEALRFEAFVKAEAAKGNWRISSCARKTHN
jgi:hypothetical protein